MNWLRRLDVFRSIPRRAQTDLPLKLVVSFLLLFSPTPPVMAQVSPVTKGIEYSVGTALLLYQSVYSIEATFGLEGAVCGAIAGSWGWQAGGRLGLSPVQPELFGGLVVAQSVDFWRPTIGIELGVTSRAKFGEGDALLRETRHAMEGAISPFYVAVQTDALSFAVAENWRVSVLDLHVGTHLSHIGRTLRLQIGILSVGANI